MFKFTKRDTKPMKKKVISILKQKENIYIFLLFLLFFPLKTQLNNLLSYLFDILFRDGVTFKFFTPNFTGTLIGCEKMAQMLELKPNMNWFQKHGMYFVQFIPSILTFYILLKRWLLKKTFTLLDWFLVVICCFSVLKAINKTYILLTRFELLSNHQTIRNLTIIVIFLFIGSFIFIKVFSFKQRIQTLVFGILGFYASIFLWMKFLGPKILPII